MDITLSDGIDYVLGTKGDDDNLLVGYTLNDKTFVKGTLSGEYYVTTSSNMAVRLQSSGMSGGGLLSPESSGEFTFYIIPKRPTIGETVNIKLSLSGYVGAGSPLTRSGNDSVQELLRGHIQFFRTKEGSVYSDLLEDGNLSVEMTGGIVEVTVYWVWEGLFSNYTDSTGWVETDYNTIVRSITQDIDDAQASESYYSRYFGQIIQDVLYIDQNSAAEEWHGDHIVWSRKSYLTDKYNEADQMIGITFDYILLEITLEQ